MDTSSNKLRIYNSLSGKKESFKPLSAPNVGMYVCGPTVYSNVHLGNCRTFISFDLVYRYLSFIGYKVRYVRNITDAGHLENDADEGEDRITKKARLEQIEPMEVVQRYTVDFHQTMSQFNTRPPSIEPTATGHIIEQIEIIKQILEVGLAYEVNGSVYFDVLKFNEKHTYGKLSGRQLEDMVHNTRTLDGQHDKKNPQDFALWKKAEPVHIMRWPSPWSDGFPGWHLECTAMSTKYLGKQFDIHGGGMDLKFPHHECEIAQAESVTGEAPVSYWMHANMLTLNGKKMAKSTGNNILPHEIFSGSNNILEKAFSPSVVRFFMLQAHYRSMLDFSNDALMAAEKGFTKLMEAQSAIETLQTSERTEGFMTEEWVKSCFAAMDDDFNSPVLIAQLFEAVKFINLVKDGKSLLNTQDKKLLSQAFDGFVFEVLGLKKEDKLSKDNNLDGVVQMLIDMRKEARDRKDFAASDRIRDDLSKLGIQLKDGKEGTTYSVE